MSKVAILFPGQGSQFKQMGADFREYPEYCAVESQLLAMMPDCQRALAGDLDIDDTRYAQPILFTNQVGILEVVRSQFDVGEVVFGGFSLGEYSAYYGAGMYDLPTGLEIIKVRSELMASVDSTYATKVVLGLTKDQLSAVVRNLNENLSQPVLISNHNLEKQLLVNFEASDSEVVVEALKRLGAKRVLDLAVSGPFHTKIFAEAADQFQQFASTVDLKPGSDNLYLNLTGRKYNGESLPVVMHDHMVTGVAWVTEIEQMIADGIDTFVELGSKSVVSNMVKKIDRTVTIITVESESDLTKLEELWNRK